jgi:hypothetical protein
MDEFRREIRVTLLKDFRGEDAELSSNQRRQLRHKLFQTRGSLSDSKLIASSGGESGADNESNDYSPAFHVFQFKMSAVRAVSWPKRFSSQWRFQIRRGVDNAT